MYVERQLGVVLVSFGSFGSFESLSGHLSHLGHFSHLGVVWVVLGQDVLGLNSYK
jgi:hypothetical protein